MVGDTVNRAAAWYYPDTKPRADEVRGPFWHGVRVELVASAKGVTER